MVYGASLNTNTNKSIYSAGFSPMAPAPFEDDFSFSLPFSGQNFSNYMDGDFMSTFQFFNMFMMGQMPKAWQGQMFTEHFNTKSNLPALKNVYNPEIANKLANIASKNAQNMNTKGYCARGANKSLELAGLSKGETRVASAYQAEGILSKHKNFKEISVTRDDLNKLPAGCVIVWDQSAGHPHGHIAVTLGDGKEASDHVQKLVTNRNAGFSVFVPTGMNKNG